MSSYRYYVVGDCDMWAIQYAPAELAQCISRSKVIAFAIGAAQKFGRRGTRPCMRARSCRLLTVQVPRFRPSVFGHRRHQ